MLPGIMRVRGERVRIVEGSASETKGADSGFWSSSIAGVRLLARVCRAGSRAVVGTRFGGVGTRFGDVEAGVGDEL
jgi:hypothetical protein